MQQTQPLYHGTDKETAIKIIKDRKLTTTGYLGVGVCLSYKTAEKYAKQRCRDESLPQSDICVIKFGVHKKKELMDTACHCSDGGFTLHDEIGRPLMELKILNAHVTDREAEENAGEAATVVACASSRSHMPEPEHHARTAK